MSYSKQPTTFRQKTRELIEKVTANLIDVVLTDERLTSRFKTLLEQHDHEDGMNAKRLQSGSLLNFALFLAVVRPLPVIDMSRSSLFHDDHGNIGFVFYSDDTEHSLIFDYKGVTYTNSDSEVNQIFSLRLLLRGVVILECFEKRSFVDQQYLLSNDLLFCIEERKWWQFRQNGFDASDPLIVHILELVNQHPGCVTRWSCQGHPEENENEGNLCFVVRDDYHHEFVTFLNRMQDYVVEKLLEDDPTRATFPVSIKRRHLITTACEGMARCVNYTFFFPTGTIDLQTRSLKHVETFLKENLPKEVIHEPS